MAKYSEAQKQAIYRWRKKNKEKHQEYQKDCTKHWIQNHKEHYTTMNRLKSMQKYYWQKSRIYLNILLD